MSRQLTASPSRLRNLAACPRWAPDYDNRDESMRAAAEEGTRFHDLCEEITTTRDPMEWEDFARGSDPEIGDLVAEALVTVRDVVLGYNLRHFGGTSATVPVGHFKTEVGMTSPITGRQRIDMLARIGAAQAVIVDYKSNRTEPDVRNQMEAYAHTVWLSHPEIRDILLLAPTPRVTGDDYRRQLSRDTDFDRIDKEIGEIIARAADPFTPGIPGQQCRVCLGNGRCPYQAATLKDIATDPSVEVVSKSQLLDPATPADRGKRKTLIAWLKKFCEACDLQDKLWAIENPGEEVEGWKVFMSPGRKSLDPERRLETAKLVESLLMIQGDDLLSCMTADTKALARHLMDRDGFSEKEAKARVAEVLAGVMRRGADFPVFRQVAGKREIEG